MNKNIFEVMVDLEHKLNIQTVGENYLDKNINWNSYIILKSGALVDSLMQKADVENKRVRTIDLLSSTISETIQEKGIKKCIALFKYWFEDEDGESSLKQFENDTIEDLLGLFISTRDVRFLYLKAIFHKQNISNEDVYMAYITKNCLNQFRQDNGDKEGTYKKDWNNTEDTIVAYRLAKKLKADEKLYEYLYKDLELHYKNEVLNQSTTNRLVYSLDNERYVDDLEFIANGLKVDEEKFKGSFIVSKDSKPINKVYVGTQNTLCHKDFVKDIDFLDDINWVACQEFDDLAVGYLMEATSEQKEELKKLVIDWLNNNLEQPNFFEVENIREISKEEFFEKHYIAK